MAFAQQTIDYSLDEREYAMIRELEELYLSAEDGIPMETNWHRRQRFEPISA